jgi:cation-transporting ATPase E
MWSSWEGFWEHMSPGNESFEEVTARNAMLIFLILSGISQLLFIYPLAKFYSVDGAVSRDLKPTILAVLLFLLVAAIYEVPQVAMGIASLALFPTEYYLMIIGFVVIWFLFATLLLKSRHMKKVSDAAESAYQKSLEAETGKDE